MAHRPRRADIAEPALLLQAREVGNRALVRKQAVLHAGEKHHGKLQSLGRMQRHHLHAIVVRVGLTLARLEHGMREKGLERRQLALGFRLRRKSPARR